LLAIPVPSPRYELPDENRKGKLELTWIFPGEDGIACTLGSEGNVALIEATRTVAGSATPYSISGSLPLVRWLQDEGFDVQIVGYGLSERYHAEDECCSLAKMAQATQILSTVISRLEDLS
jgi:acetylornithine deacetylase